MREIHAMRHGEAKYKQLQISRIAQSNDLTFNGVQIVRENILKLVDGMDKNSGVVIWSSPYGRTLQTAKIAMKVLQESGIKIKEKRNPKGDKWERSIRVFKKFEEVRNFNLTFFLFCLNGGTIFYNRKKISLDKTITNKRNLTFTEYYNQRAWQYIDKAKIPDDFMLRMNSIETEADSMKRFNSAIDTVRRLTSSEKKISILIVTHQGLLSGLSPEIVNPGDIISFLI